MNLNTIEVIFKSGSKSVQVLLDAWGQVCINLRKVIKETTFNLLTRDFGNNLCPVILIRDFGNKFVSSSLDSRFRKQFVSS
jgi:hypothetical protein